MKTLKEHNDEVRRMHDSTKNGIECVPTVNPNWMMWRGECCG